MLDWNNYRSELMQRLGELGKLTPETMKGVVALGNAGNKTDLLGAKVREPLVSPYASPGRVRRCRYQGYKGNPGLLLKPASLR